MSPAEQLARQAHEGQTEQYSDHPYTQHLERVAALVEGEDAKAVAWLHDILEDTWVTAKDLARQFPAPIVEAVQILTRMEDDSYRSYIEDILMSRNPLAIAVKVADLKDHLREETLKRLPQSLLYRYIEALLRLT